MPKLFQNSQHLLRVSGLFLLGLVLFILLRAVFIPKGFGEFGHYRSGSLADNRARPATFAGKKACLECHTDVEAAQKGSRHAALSCEVCHGPQAAHATASDPSTLKPKRPEGEAIQHLCLTCHENNVAKPAGFKQIDPKAHMGGGRCIECHSHHAPQIIKGAEPEAGAEGHRAKRGPEVGGAQDVRPVPAPASKAAAKEVKK